VYGNINENSIGPGGGTDTSVMMITTADSAIPYSIDDKRHALVSAESASRSNNNSPSNGGRQIGRPLGFETTPQSRATSRANNSDVAVGFSSSSSNLRIHNNSSSSNVGASSHTRVSTPTITAPTMTTGGGSPVGAPATRVALSLPGVPDRDSIVSPPH
jgi:hypothetical protein